MPDRRRFLQQSAVAAAVFGVPLSQAHTAVAQDAPSLAPAKLYSTDLNRYWA